MGWVSSSSRDTGFWAWERDFVFFLARRDGRDRVMREGQKSVIFICARLGWRGGSV